MSKKIKKSMFAIVALLGVMLFASCGDSDKEISSSSLPDAAKAFITQYFPMQTILHAERDKDNGTRYYEVTLSSGTQIDFDSSGTWIKVDCKFNALPTGILPDKITTYITDNYPAAIATEVDKEYGGYQVQLNNARKLIFSADGTFISSQIDF